MNRTYIIKYMIRKTEFIQFEPTSMRIIIKVKILIKKKKLKL